MTNQVSPSFSSFAKQAVSVTIKYLLPLVVSVYLCYLLFAGQDLGEMLEIIRTQCNYWWIALGLLLSILSHVLRAMRWNIQLRALGIKVPMFALVLSIFGTYAVNLVFPRLGELWRTGYIARRQNVAFDRVFGSMIADRLSDTVTVALLVIAAFVFAGDAMVDYLSQNQALYAKLISLVTSPWVWGAMMLGVVILWWGVVRFRENAFVIKIKEFCLGLWKGFAVITSMPGKGLWLLLTVCLWGCYFIQLYVAFFAFDATAQVIHVYGIGAVLVCFVLSSISMGVPSNGGIGPYQWAIIFGLSLYTSGIPTLNTTVSSTFANLVLGSNTLLLIILGLFTFACIAIDRRRK